MDCTGDLLSRLYGPYGQIRFQDFFITFRSRAFGQLQQESFNDSMESYTQVTLLSRLTKPYSNLPESLGVPLNGSYAGLCFGPTLLILHPSGTRRFGLSISSSATKASIHDVALDQDLVTTLPISQKYVSLPVIQLKYSFSFSSSFLMISTTSISSSPELHRHQIYSVTAAVS